MEQIKAFLEKAKTDAGLMVKLGGLGADAGADGIISLAGEYGFTLTKEEVENAMGAAAPGNELSEEQLAAVAGGGLGSGGPTQNRYNPAECRKAGRTMYNCVGLLKGCWCDHYKQTFIKTIVINARKHAMYVHECVMGCYKYIGDANGDVVPE